MPDTRYNGWTNYQTWNVHLWLSNDEGAHNHWSERAVELVQEAAESNGDNEARDEAARLLAEELEADFDDARTETYGCFADLLTHALGMVDWREIAKHYTDEVPIYSAGWNMPGYMPDSSPALFTDASDALDYITAEMQQRADALSDGIDAECLSDDKSHIPGLIQELEHYGSSAKADSDGEFGQTIGGTHYFVAKQ